MAVLPDADRAAVSADIQRKLSAARESVGLNKADLRAAINATDDWINSNKGSFNSALPAAAQAELTAAQKGRLFLFVAEKRFKGGA